GTAPEGTSPPSEAPAQPAKPKRTVTGTVKDPTGAPTPGGIVTIEGTTNSVMTDENGHFTIENAPDGPLSLSIQASGYKDRKVLLSADSFDVAVGVEYEQGETINVFGRAPVFQRQNLRNGASTVDGEELNKVPAQTLEDAMVGKFTGANIVRNSG